MKKVFFGIFILLALVFLTTAAFTQETNSVVEANNQFAFDLYAQYKSKEGNIFYSPYSISAVLAMTFEGARGETADQMQKVFHFPSDSTLRRDSYQAIYNSINKADKQYKLSTANALWAQQDYKFMDEYLSLVENYYGGKVTSMDFVGQTEQSRLTINSWIEEQTNRKIIDMIPAGAIHSGTRLVLTNAIYFKGLWLEQFNKDDTQEEDFRISSDNIIKASMMRLTDSKGKYFNYAETDGLQILQLPYEGEELSMLIILPNQDSLNAVEDLLSVEKLSEWKGQLIKNKVDVYLPRFKFATEYLMAEDLSVMGMPLAFSDSADFSGMTEVLDLYIDQVIHKAFVEVNEEGTEAAAATALTMVGRSAGFEPETKIFRADHPFIFIIHDNTSGNILFMGRVVDPTK